MRRGAHRFAHASACALLAASGAAPGASGHVVPSPTFVATGSVTTVSLGGPNERDEPMTGFGVSVPAGVRIVRAEREGQWQVAEESARQASWTGGSLAAEEEVAFRLELETTAPPGPVSLAAEQRYPGGEVVRWEVPLTVVPGKPDEERDLGAALAIGVAGLLVAAGVALALVARRRRLLRLPGEEG